MPPWIYTVLGRRWFRGRKETAALISQNRRIVSDIGKHTKSSARQRFFSFPRCGGRCFLIDLGQFTRNYTQTEKRAADNK